MDRHRILPASLVRLCLALLLVAPACDLGVAKASAARSIPAIRALLPAFEALDVRIYMDAEGCEYLVDDRGAFASNLDQEGWCRVWDFEDRHPGGNAALAPGPFDDAARMEFTALRHEIDEAGLDLDYLDLLYDPDGHIAPGSIFAVGPCVTFFYDPRWSVLPESIEGVSVSTAIDDDWYQTDICP